jgi:predicted DNA binding CopG/RHH family protein
MKTTLEIPDALFRKAKSAAAEQGIPLRALVSEALEEKLSARKAGDKPWMKSFGKLRDLHKDLEKINRIIEEEFEQIEPEDWQ